MATRPPVVDDEWETVDDWETVDESVNPDDARQFGQEQMAQFGQTPQVSFAPTKESLKGALSGDFPTARLGEGVMGGLRGAMREAPLVAMRAASFPADIVSGAASKSIDRFGSPEMVEADLKRAMAREQVKKALQAPFEAGDQEGTGERIGRGLARAGPQLGLAAITSGGSIPAQMALSAGSQGAQSLAEGETPAQAALSVGLAGIAPGAGRLVSKFGQSVKAKAIEQYLKALNPTRAGLKREAAEITPELLKRGVSGDLESLAKRGAAESKDIGGALEGAYGAAARRGQTINATQIADDLERLKAPFTVMGSAGQSVPANPGAIQAVENIQASLRELGDTVAPDQLWKFRKNIDDIVAATNGFQRELPRGTATAIAKQARSAIQKELTSSAPDVARLNSEYALWQGLEDVATATLRRKVGQQGSAGWMARTAGAVAGAGIGSSGGFAGAGIGAALGQEASQRLVGLMTSPAWRTVSAVQKARLAKLLTSGTPEAATNYVLRLSAALSGQE